MNPTIERLDIVRMENGVLGLVVAGKPPMPLWVNTVDVDGGIERGRVVLRPVEGLEPVAHWVGVKGAGKLVLVPHETLVSCGPEFYGKEEDCWAVIGVPMYSGGVSMSRGWMIRSGKVSYSVMVKSKDGVWNTTTVESDWITTESRAAEVVVRMLREMGRI